MMSNLCTTFNELFGIIEIHKYVHCLFSFLVLLCILVITVVIFKHVTKAPKKNEKELLKIYLKHVCKTSINPTASEEDMKECIRILNEFPHLINCKVYESKNTPFLLSCNYGNIPLLRFMLKNGAKISSKNLYNESAVYLAARRTAENPIWNSSMLDILYEAGCKLSIVTTYGMSALQLAVEYGNVSLTQWLLIRGAHKTIQNRIKLYNSAVLYNNKYHQNIAALIHLYCPELIRNGLPGNVHKKPIEY